MVGLLDATLVRDGARGSTAGFPAQTARPVPTRGVEASIVFSILKFCRIGQEESSATAVSGTAGDREEGGVEFLKGPSFVFSCPDRGVCQLQGGEEGWAAAGVNYAYRVRDSVCVC